MLTRPLLLLRFEGLTLLTAAITLYALAGGSWWIFALLLFAPDVAAVGYLGGPRLGAALYNLAHVTVVPVVLIAVAYAVGAEPALLVGLVWLAHVGLDRMLGYGLKLPSGFQDTHLGRIGRAADR